MRKRIGITICLTALLVLASMTTAFAATPFSDVAGTPFEEAVTQLYNDGIVNGYGDGTFAPYGTITRAEACKLIAYAFGERQQAGFTHRFRDMDGHSWANGYVGYAFERGIVTGYPDGTFRPGNPISENEMLTMVVRAMGYTDAALGGQWPANYIAKGAELGLTSETGFASAPAASRGMAALLVYKSYYPAHAAAAGDKYGVVIDYRSASAGKQAQVKLILQDGMVRTFDVASGAAFVKQLSSGDIVSLGLDAKDALTSLKKMDADFASEKSFEGSVKYAGMQLATDVKVFSYGTTLDFKSSGTVFSSDAVDYGVRSVRLMHNVTASAFYIVDKDRITAMIVPTDTGFTGRMYGLVTEVANAVDYKGNKVEAIDFMLGRDAFTIMTNGRLDAVPREDLYSESGNLFELTLKNGVITNIADSDEFGTIRGKRFEELTSDKDFQMILDYDRRFAEVQTSGGTERFGIMEDVVVYVIEKNGDYAAGTASAIKEGVRIRAFDVTDDGTDNADVVVIDKRSDR